MKLSKKGLDLIKEFEGCRLEAYHDVCGKLTIGYGHLLGYSSERKITKERATELLVQDISRFETYVNNLNKKFAYHFNQNQFDALVSFTYNCGEGNLIKLTSQGKRNKKEIASHLPLYCKANGKAIFGLQKRREKEQQLFNTPCDSQITPCKIALNISRRFTEYVKIDLYSLDFTESNTINTTFVNIFGSGEVSSDFKYELCLVEDYPTKDIYLGYIECDKIKTEE